MITTEQLQEEGYEPGAPNADSAALDRGVARESSCIECGHTGLSYEGWLRGRSYRAVAICPECGFREEF